MVLTEILALDKWIEVEKQITAKFDIDANVFDAKGIRLTDYKNWANPLCPEIKATDKGQSFICAVAHMNIAAQAARNKKALSQECDAGLMKLVVPVFVGDDFVGALCGCGVLPEGGEVESFLINKITGIDEAEIESLSKGIQTLSMEKLAEIEAYLIKCVDKIVSDYEMMAL